MRRGLYELNLSNNKMNWAVIKAIVILPGTGLLFIPAVLLWLTRTTRFASHMATPGQILFWVGLFIGLSGLGLLLWTMRLFSRLGRGTPAPWEPPKQLVVAGPYRHVRNPMITGVLLVQLAEALLLRSWPLAAWMVFFFIANTVYFPLAEERDLERRFGMEYAEYRKNVPRWIPRLRPWKKGTEREADHRLREDD